MGKLSAGDGEAKVRQYIGAIGRMQRNAEKNFYDMDFENAIQRDQIEAEIENIVSYCRQMEAVLETLSFER